MCQLSPHGMREEEKPNVCAVVGLLSKKLMGPHRMLVLLPGINSLHCNIDFNLKCGVSESSAVNL